MGVFADARLSLGRVTSQAPARSKSNFGIMALLSALRGKEAVGSENHFSVLSLPGTESLRQPV
jgi:hypothetical protein